MTFWKTNQAGFGLQLTVFCYDPRFNTFNVWGNLKGLACNHVYKIIQDQSGMLWLGTESGILSFNPQWNYGMSFPALSHIKMNEDFRAGTLLHDGRILFGSKSGLCIFNPELMIESNLLPDIFLTELSVKGVTRISDLSDVHQIILQYDENYFSVEFSSSDLASSNEYSYRYRLIGLENDWNIVQKAIHRHDTPMFRLENTYLKFNLPLTTATGKTSE